MKDWKDVLSLAAITIENGEQNVRVAIHSAAETILSDPLEGVIGRNDLLLRAESEAGRVIGQLDAPAPIWAPRALRELSQNKP